jgi:hypothetical protein
LLNTKYNAARRVEIYKARLVVKGFMQRPGFEFNEVFAPVTSKATSRVLLAVVVTKKMFVRQLDIKTAFLLGTLDPQLELYCDQPPGFVQTAPDGSALICRLVRSLYGLKQAPRVWSETLNAVLKQHGYRASKFDPALYLKRMPSSDWCFVLTYVDDFLVCVDELFLYDLLVKAIEGAGWTVKQMGLPKQFLSLNMKLRLTVEGRCTEIILSQESAIADMVEKFSHIQLSPKVCVTPILSSDISSAAISSPLLPNNTLYLSLVGGFIYLSTCTRADIAFAVSSLSRYSANPTQAQWEAAKRLLRYRRDNQFLGLCFTHTPTLTLSIFSDASFGECKQTRKAQSGVAILAAGSLVTWISKRQVTVSLSTAESEYQALSSTAREVMWSKQLVIEMGFPPLDPTIQCDSTGALGWCGDYKLEPRAKHIDIIHHYVKDLVLDGRLKVVYVNTKDNLADPFTKALAMSEFWSFVKRHGIVPSNKA